MKIKYVTKLPMTFTTAIQLLQKAGCKVENTDGATAVLKDPKGNTFSIAAHEPDRVAGCCDEKIDPRTMATTLGMVSQFQHEYHKIMRAIAGQGQSIAA